MNGLACLWLQDAGGTCTCTLLPDTQAVYDGITDIRDKRYEIGKTPHVHF
jgi:hypothetical protein